MIYHNFILKNGDEPIISQALRCRDVGYSYIRAYAPRVANPNVTVSVNGVEFEAVERIAHILAAIPQYRNTTFTPVLLLGEFAITKAGINISGAEIDHAYYWTALLLRIAGHVPDWRDGDDLLKKMRCGQSIDFGWAKEHRLAWQRLKLGTDIRTADMRRMGGGPVGVYQRMQLRAQPA